jgi:hypothetical protein
MKSRKPTQAEMKALLGYNRQQALKLPSGQEIAEQLSDTPIVSDPPYGISYQSKSPRSRLGRKRGGFVGNVRYIDKDAITILRRVLSFPTKAAQNQHPPTTPPSPPHSQ